MCSRNRPCTDAHASVRSRNDKGRRLCRRPLLIYIFYGFCNFLIYRFIGLLMQGFVSSPAWTELCMIIADGTLRECTKLMPKLSKSVRLFKLFARSMPEAPFFAPSFAPPSPGSLNQRPDNAPISGEHR